MKGMGLSGMVGSRWTLLLAGLTLLVSPVGNAAPAAHALSTDSAVRTGLRMAQAVPGAAPGAAPVAAPGVAPGTSVSPAVAPAPVSAGTSVSPSAAPAPAAPALAPSIQARLPQLKAFSARMQVPLDQLLEGLNGLELVYQRRYGDARTVFRTMEQAYPQSAIGPFGLVMLAQAQMGENLDFLHDAVYTNAYKVSTERLDAAIGRGDAVAWNSFLRGCAKGVNSLYLYRKDKLLAAVQEGMGALSDIEKSSKLDPQFKDPYMGFGVYNYWRSAVTLRYKSLPFFPDKRDQGLKQLEMARDGGIITPVLARIALGYSYLDRGIVKRALYETNSLKKDYPDNVLNLILAGQVYARGRDLEKAKASWKRVLELDTRNVLAAYYLGNHMLNREYNYPEAVTYLEKYVKEMPNEFYAASARTRLGDAYFLTNQTAKAEEQWKLALQADGSYKLAKARAEGKRPKARKLAPAPPRPERKAYVGAGAQERSREAMRQHMLEQAKKSGALPLPSTTPATKTPATKTP